jgi:hypothetical protein
MKYRLIVFCLVSIVTISADSKNSDQPTMSGVAIQTYEDSHFIIQTARYFFRVEKSNLTPEIRTELDRAVETGQWRGFTIPLKAISHAWPVAQDFGGGQAVPELKTNSNEMRDHIIRHDNQVEIGGIIAASFQESHYIVLSNGSLYLILKSSLSENENEQLARMSPGERVDVSVPTDSLQIAGQFTDAAESKKTAKRSETESVKRDGDQITISGVVFHSFSDPLVIIRVNQTYFQLKREWLEGSVNPKLNLPGTFVKVRAPIEAVDFVWTVPTIENASPIRAPSSNAGH